ncbi:MAG: LON peptidase substrate-binding domain-containing protein, partial [Caulobacteraceae bacterium]
MMDDAAKPPEPGPASGPTTAPGPAPGPAPATPADAFIVVPSRRMVLFPEIVLPLMLESPAAVAAGQQAVREQRQVLIVLQRDAEKAEPAAEDLHRTGSVANILRYVTTPAGEHHMICQGAQRFRISDFVPGWPFLLARGLTLPEPTDGGQEVEARFIN